MPPAATHTPEPPCRDLGVPAPPSDFRHRFTPLQPSHTDTALGFAGQADPVGIRRSLHSFQTLTTHTQPSRSPAVTYRAAASVSRAQSLRVPHCRAPAPPDTGRREHGRVSAAPRWWRLRTPPPLPAFSSRFSLHLRAKQRGGTRGPLLPSRPGRATALR